MKSILQSEKECYICRVMFDQTMINRLDCHHIYGGANRKKSEQDGLKVWLCKEHHLGNQSAHKDPVIALFLKKRGQKKYEETHSREEFMKRYGRNYL